MSLNVRRDFPSDHFDDVEIPVEFVVLHYTACPLKRTIELFCGPASHTCAHFVLDVNGDVYDLGDFFNGRILKGAHAGESRFLLGNKSVSALNASSIGIEIINLNGNIRDYTEAQYAALAELLRHLKQRFPTLDDPNRIVGHEQIAGHRGKADPGLRFDWNRVYRDVYGAGAAPFPERKPICPPAVATELAKRAQGARDDDQSVWTQLSLDLETSGRDRALSKRLVVRTDSQTAELWRDGQLAKTYTVSTARNGLGTVEGSYCTPPGKLRVAHKIGDGAAAGAIFKARLPTGATWRPSAADAAPNAEDLILTRILWLEGLDAANKNTIDRYVYLHGTNQEQLLGTPASHGCVRFGNADIIEVFNALDAGSEVEIV